MSYGDEEYHRRRSEIGLEHAVLAEDSGSAAAHLELAWLHRARRLLIAKSHLNGWNIPNGRAMSGTDKEA